MNEKALNDTRVCRGGSLHVFLFSLFLSFEGRKKLRAPLAIHL